VAARNSAADRDFADPVLELTNAPLRSRGAFLPGFGCSLRHRRGPRAHGTPGFRRTRGPSRLAARRQSGTLTAGPSSLRRPARGVSRLAPQISPVGACFRLPRFAVVGSPHRIGAKANAGPVWRRALHRPPNPSGPRLSVQETAAWAAGAGCASCTPSFAFPGHRGSVPLYDASRSALGWTGLRVKVSADSSAGISLFFCADGRARPGDSTEFASIPASPLSGHSGRRQKRVHARLRRAIAAIRNPGTRPEPVS
jgi:hypothetical protein